MSVLDKRAIIEQGRTILGIELGSTRIKAVLIDEKHELLASGGCAWENRLENGVWTYSMEDVIGGLQSCYAALAQDVSQRYGAKLTTFGAIGVSAMMHGYLAFDAQDRLLVPFRTWRNTMTGEAAKELTELFHFNIPQRWSVAHLRQAMLSHEPHVPEIRFMTTLAGYVHFLLTGERVLGVGDASGMFPIDSATGDYDAALLERFDEHCAGERLPWKLGEILPKVLRAGETAGTLTEAGARLLDPSGTLQAGIPLCPPEGDAGTGMTATNSVAPRTGNVSAGTSVFAMVVLEKPLQRVHPEIDLVTTPSGRAVAIAFARTLLPTKAIVVARPEHISNRPTGAGPEIRLHRVVLLPRVVPRKRKALRREGGLQNSAAARRHFEPQHVPQQHEPSQRICKATTCF